LSDYQIVGLQSLKNALEVCLCVGCCVLIACWISGTDVCGRWKRAGWRRGESAAAVDPSSIQ